MNAIWKGTAAAAIIGTLALASVTPSEARNRWIGPAAAGFAAGAIVGSAAAASSYGYYGPGYAYGPAYNSYAYDAPVYGSYGSYGYAPTYAPTYSYGGAYDAYAYEAAPVYSAPTYYRRSGSRGCVTQGNYGQSADESACNR